MNVLLAVANVTSSAPIQNRSSPVSAVTPLDVTVVGDVFALVFVAAVLITGGLVVSRPLHAKHCATADPVVALLVTVRESEPTARFHKIPMLCPSGPLREVFVRDVKPVMVNVIEVASSEMTTIRMSLAAAPVGVPGVIVPDTPFPIDVAVPLERKANYALQPVMESLKIP